MARARATCLLLSLQLLFPLPLRAQDLDLSSTTRTAEAADLTSSVSIMIGGTIRSINNGDMLTHAEMVAVQQVLSSGNQNLQLGSSGNATGGSVTLNGFSSLGHLAIPDGVTAIHDFAGNSTLNLAGNLTNAGSFYAVSTSAAVTSATLAALNITNQTSGLITSMLPTGGLPGFSSAIPNLNLSLNAIEDIINTGTISSAANLSLVAGNSINNASAAALVQAVSNLSLQAPVVFNAGTVESTAGNLAIATSNLQNSGLLQSIAGTLSLTNSLTPSAGLEIYSTALAVMRAQNLQILPGSATVSNATLINSGNFIADNLSIDAGNGTIDIQSASFDVTGAATAISANAGNFLMDSGSSLQAGSLTVTANDVAIDGTINVAGGTVVLAPNAAKSIGIGGTNPAGIFQVSTAELDSITAGNLIIGNRNLGGGVTLGDSIDISARPYNLQIQNGGNYSSGSATVTLGGRALTINVGGSLTTADINGSSSSSISLTSTGALTQSSGSLSAPTISLSSSGTIGTSVQPLSVDASTLSLNAANAFITEANDVNVDTASVSSGTLEILAGGNITVGTLSTRNLVLASTAANGSITLTANVSATGAGTSTARLTATGTGGISQSAGVLTATNLVLQAGSGGIGSAANPLDTEVDGSVVGGLKANSTGNIYINEATAIDIGASSAGGNLVISAGQAIKTSGTIAAAGVVDLQTNAGHDITLNSNITGSAIILKANGSTTADIIRTSGTLSAGTITLFSTGSSGTPTSPLISAAGNIAAASTNGGIYLSNSGALALTASAAGTLKVLNNDSISSSGALSAAGLHLETTANNGSITLNHNAAGSSSVTMISHGSGTIIQNAGRITGGAIGLTTGTDLGSAANPLDITASSLAVNTSGSAYIDENDTVSFTGASTASGNLQLTAGNTITVNGTLNAADVLLQTTANNGSVALNSGITASGSITIIAHGSGSIAHSAGVLTGPVVTLASTSGNIGSPSSATPVATGDPNHIHTNTASLTATTTGGVFLYNAGALNASITSNGAIELTNGTGDLALTLGAQPLVSVSLTTSSGSITVNNDIVLTPLLAGNGGAVYLNASGDVSTQNITTSGNDTGNGGQVTITAGQDISLLNVNTSSGVNNGSAGGITLSAGGTVLTGNLTGTADTPANAGTGATVTITAGDTIETGAIDNHSHWGAAPVRLTAQNGVVVNGSIISWTTGANTVFAPFITSSGGVVIETTTGGILVGGDILTYNQASLVSPVRGFLNPEGGAVSLLGATTSVQVNGNIETWGLNDAFGGHVFITLDNGTVDVAGTINTSAQRNSAGNITISGLSGPLSINASGASTDIAIDTSSGGDASHYAGTLRLLAPNSDVTINGGMNMSSSDRALSGDLFMQANSLNISGLINTSNQKVDGGTVDLSARTTVNLASVNTSGGVGGGSAYGGLVMIASGTAGLALSDLTVEDITTTGRGTGKSAGSVVLLSSGNITSGAINSAGIGGASGAPVSLLAGAPGTAGNINFSAINTSGAAGGNITVISMGTGGTLDNGGAAITANAGAINQVAGSIALSSMGKIAIGDLSATALNASSTSSYAGSIFITSGSTDPVSSTITVGNVDTSSTNVSGNLFLVHAVGAAAPTTGARTVAAEFVGAPTTNPGSITGDTVIRFDVAAGVVENFSPGGFSTINATGSTITVDSAGDGRLFAPIVNLNGDFTVESMVSQSTAGIASPISIYSVGAITVNQAVDASSVGGPGAPVSFSSNSGQINLNTVNVSGDAGGSIIISTPNEFNLANGASLIARSASGTTAGGRIQISVPEGQVNLGAPGNTTGNVIDVSGATGGIIDIQASGNVNVYQVGLSASGTSGSGGSISVASLEGVINLYQGYSAGVPFATTIDANGTTFGGNISLYGKNGLNALADSTLSEGTAAITITANGVSNGGYIRMYAPLGNIDLAKAGMVSATADAATGIGGTIESYSSGATSVNSMSTSAATGGSIDSVSGGFNLSNSHNITADGLNGNGGSVTIYTQGVRQYSLASISLGTADNQTNNRVSANGTAQGGLVRMNAGGHITSSAVDIEATGTTGDGGRITLDARRDVVLLHEFFDVGSGAVHHNAQIDASSATASGGIVNVTAQGSIISARDTSVTGGSVASTSSIRADGIIGGGQVDLSAQTDINLTETNYVSASSTGAGTTGGSINLDAPGTVTSTKLTTESPIGGSIVVNAGTLQLLNNKVINANGTDGSGGSVNIQTTGSTTLGTQNNNSSNYISASGATSGGSILINSASDFTSNEVSLIANGGTGNGGSVNVSASGLLTLRQQYWDAAGTPQNFNANIEASSASASGGTISLSGSGGILASRDTSDASKSSGNSNSAVIRAIGPTADGAITVTSSWDVNLTETLAVDAQSTGGTGGSITVNAGRHLYTPAGSADQSITDDGLTADNMTLRTTANNGSVYIRGDATAQNSISITANGSGNIIHSAAVNTAVLKAPSVAVASGSGSVGSRTSGSPAPLEHLDAAFVFTDTAALTARTGGNVYINNLSAAVSVGNSNAGTGNNVFMLQAAGTINTAGTITTGSVVTSSSTCCGGYVFGNSYGRGTTHLETYASNGNINIGSNVTGFGALNLEAAGTGKVTVDSGATARSYNITTVRAYDADIAGSLQGKGQYSFTTPPAAATTYNYYGSVRIIPNGSQATELGRVAGAQTAGMDIDQAEFGRITTDTLQIGERVSNTFTNTGDITVTNDLNLAGPGPAGVYSLYFLTGGNYTATGKIVSLRTGANDNRYIQVVAGGNANTGSVSGGYYTYFEAGQALTVDGNINNNNSASASKYVSLNAQNSITILPGMSVDTQYLWGDAPVWVNDGSINATGYADLSHYTYIPNTSPPPTTYEMTVSGSGTITAPLIYLESYHYVYDSVTYASTLQGGSLSVEQNAINGPVSAYASKGAISGTGNISIKTTNSDLVIGSISGAFANFETSGNNRLTLPTLSHETISVTTGTLLLNGNLTATNGGITVQSPAGASAGLTITSGPTRTLSSTTGTTITANDGTLTFASSVNINGAPVTLKAAGNGGAVQINSGVSAASNAGINVVTYALTNNGTLSSSQAAAAIDISSAAALIVSGTGTIQTTGTGANSISLTASGPNQLMFSGNQTFNATGAGTVSLTSDDASGGITFAGGTTQTIAAAASLVMSTPTLTFAGNGASLNASGAATVSVVSPSGSDLTVVAPGGGTATISTANGGITFTPAGGQNLTFLTLGAGAANLQLNGGPVALNIAAPNSVSVPSGFSLNSGNSLVVNANNLNNSGTLSAAGPLSVLASSGNLDISGFGGRLISGTGVSAVSTNGSVSLNQLNVSGTLSGSASTSFDAITTDTLVLGAITAGTGSNISAASLSQAAGSLLTAPSINLVATAGSIGAAATPFSIAANSLTFSSSTDATIIDANNLTVGVSNAGGAVLLTSGGALSLAGDLTAGTNLNLSTGTGLTQTGGTVSGDALTLSVGSGNVTLNTNVASLPATSLAAGRTLSINNGSSLVLGTNNAASLSVQAAGHIATTADLAGANMLFATTNDGNISLANNLTGTNISLTTGGAGVITQAAGTLVAGATLSIASAGPVVLSTSVDNLAITAAGSAMINESSGVNVLASSAGNLRVNAAGSITTSGLVNTQVLHLETTSGSNGNIRLGADAAGTTSVTLTVDGSGNISQTAGRISGGVLSATSAAALDLDTDVSTLHASTSGNLTINELNSITLGTISATGLNANADGNVNTAGALSFVNSATVTAGGAIDTRAGTLSAAALSLTSGTGDISVASLTATSGSIAAIANGGSTIVSEDSALTASRDISLTGNTNVVLGARTQMRAGTLSGANSSTSTQLGDYDTSAFIQPGTISLRSNNGNINLGDGANLLSVGGNVQMWSGNNVTLAANSVLFSQGGNIWINATNVATIFDNASFTAVGRYLPTGTIVLDNQVIRNYQGGGIAIYAGLPNLDLDNELHSQVMARLGSGYVKIQGAVDRRGSTLSDMNGGSIEMIAPGAGKIGVIGSLFTADGGVIRIDPPGDLIDIHAGGVFLAIGPELVGPPPAPPIVTPPLAPVVATPVAPRVVHAVAISSPTQAMTARSVPVDTMPEYGMNTATPMQLAIGCADAPMTNWTEGNEGWSIATGSCQSFSFSGKRGSSVVGEGGTALASQDERALRVKQGKVVAVSGQDGLTIETEQGKIFLPAGATALVERKSDRYTRIAFLGGQHSTIEIERNGQRKIVAAEAGEEMIVAENDATEEELIPVDGIERVTVAGAVQVSNLAIRKSRFNTKEMLERDRLLSCPTGCFPAYLKQRLKDMKAETSQGAPVAKSPLRPVAAITPLSSASAPVVALQTDAAILRHAGDAAFSLAEPGTINLTAGEVMVVATSRTTVKAGDVLVRVEPGSVTIIEREKDDLLKVVTLWNSRKGDVQIESSGRNMKVEAGNQTVVAQMKAKLDAHIKNDDTARRRVVQTALPSGKQVLSAEVSFLSMLDNSTVLKSVLNSRRDEDRQLSEKLCKMAVILNHVTASHGAYGTTAR